MHGAALTRSRAGDTGETGGGVDDLAAEGFYWTLHEKIHQA